MTIITKEVCNTRKENYPLVLLFISMAVDWLAQVCDLKSGIFAHGPIELF